MAIDASTRHEADGGARRNRERAARTGGSVGRTLSGEPVRELYTEADLPQGIGARPPAYDPIGRPGAYPYTRGIYESMYRGRLWTMRQFAGFGTSEETNERFHYLLEHGQTGLSTAFDMPSLMGHDSDHSRALGEVGREGVAIDTLDDMQMLFAGIDLGEVSVSMTINAPAAIMLAFYVVAAGASTADGAGGAIAAERLSGTIQADILKEYIAQKEWCFPIDPAMRLCGDMIEWCTHHMPRWHPISISRVSHPRGGGDSPAGARVHARGRTHVCSPGGRRGVWTSTSSRPGCRSSSTPRSTSSRRSPSTVRRGGSGRASCARPSARKNERSWLMRFHSQTAGVSLTAQQPLNNIVRTTVEALAGVLGGTQSLHTNSYDEALALPTEDAVRVALRTQQVIAHETGVAATADPLGGSYYVEALTDEMERRSYEYFAKIDELGGMVQAVKQNYPQREIADAAFESAARDRRG